MMYELKNMFLCIATLAFVFQLHAVVVVCDKHNSGVSFEPAIHHHCDHDAASEHQRELTDADEHNCSPCTDAVLDITANLQKNPQRRFLPGAIYTAMFRSYCLEPAAALHNYKTAFFESTSIISSVILLI